MLHFTQFLSKGDCNDSSGVELQLVQCFTGSVFILNVRNLIHQNKSSDGVSTLSKSTQGCIKQSQKIPAGTSNISPGLPAAADGRNV